MKRAVAFVVGVTAGVLPAQAHLSTTGLGPLCGRMLLTVLPVAWLAGYALARALGLPALPAPLGIGVIVVLGLLVAADQPWPARWMGALAAVLGLLDGAAVGAELGPLHASHLVAAGIIASLLVVVSLLAGQISVLRAFAARVAVRASGGWISAIGLFMAG